MKQIVIIFFFSFISVIVYGQTSKSVLVKSNKVSTAEKKKIEKDTTGELSKEEFDAWKYNPYCRFGFDDRGLYSKQDENNDYVIYIIPGMSASELKTAAYTVLSSMFKSPKDVITSLSDNMIQLEGYASNLFTTELPVLYTEVSNDIQFSLIIHFKDGKVRYNTPSIKAHYMAVSSRNQNRVNINEPLSVHFKEPKERKSIENYFNNLIKSINSKLKKSNDW